MSARASARLREAPRRRPTARALAGPGKELLVAAALIAGLGVFHVWSRTRVVSAGYALFELQQEHARLVAAQDQLRIELGMLTSPQALDQAARTKLSKLGLAPPDRGAVWAASPVHPKNGPGRAGVDGVVNPPRPAEPIPGRALGAAGTPAAPPLAHPPLQASGARVALRAGQAGAMGP